MAIENECIFYVNGKKVVLNSVQPETTLLHYLRSNGWTGSKLGCGEGGCGACTVMVSHYSPSTNSIVHRAVNGCLMPLAAVDGMAVTTVEGLGNTRTGLNIVQERIANSHGSQCGFCTPGIVMSLYAYLRVNPKATKEEIEDCLDGNLCRCTGYRPILDAAKTFAVEEQEERQETPYIEAEIIEQGGELPKQTPAGICPSTGQPCDCKSQKTEESKNGLCYNPENITSHLIFPPFLKKYERASKKFVGDLVTWFRPSTLDELLHLKKEHQNAKFVVGNTEIGIDRKFKHLKFPVIIAPTHVAELNQLEVVEGGIEIGSAVTITDTINFLKGLVKSLPEYQTRSFSAILNQLRWFASNQIRNAASIGGNMCTASPISDLNPVFLATNTVLTIQSLEGTKKMSIRDFFLRYRVVNLAGDEILRSIFVPFTRENEYTYSFKQSRRRDDDIAIVSAGIRVLLDSGDNNEWKIKEIGFGYGGMAPKTVYCTETETKLVGEVWNENLIAKANQLLESDLPLPDNAPGGMIQFRRTLTTSFFYKFYLKVTSRIAPNTLPSSYLSAIPEFHKEISHGKQSYQVNAESTSINFPVVHQSAYKQVTGEAIYTDDVPVHQLLYAAFVQSTKANAKILSIDPTKALESRGVVRFISAADIPNGRNEVGPIIHNDEKLFWDDYVTAMGQPIGLIVATSHEDACEGALLVEVKYEEYKPILTIEQAIQSKSFQGPHYRIDLGDTTAAFKECDFIIEDQMSSGAQDHFYLEPHTTLATPGEGNEIKIIASTQSPSKTQQLVSNLLGIRDNDVVVTVKRMGGGFGGKETRSCFVSCAAALAAFVLRQPVRLTLDRDVDMSISGLRHPFLGKYKVGFNKDGIVKALEIDLFSNGGYSLDLSIPVMERALFHVDNCYKIENVRATGYCCKTNITTNTAFRGFGGPQSMLICESWIEKVAIKLNKDVNEIRLLNYYKPTDITHYKQPLPDNNIHRIHTELMQSSEFEERKQVVEKFNQENRWKKRGIAFVPTKFGMSFTVKFMNQAGALVHVYVDGSVLVSHGGTEMGQGLHTKIIQIASKALGISIEKIHISETATDKVPNTSPTAASVQSDLNGMAVLNACEQILARLAPLREENPTLTWEQLVSTAYLNQINLSAQGHYATPNIGFNFENNTGRPFNYFVWGASCSEVEIDVLTGNYHVIRSDVLMDVGESLNPAIDIGQIEGGFVQGLGWCTLEEIVWFDNGFQFTRGPGAYKIPSFNDVPVDFRVSLLKDVKNTRAIFSSKGIGEPPFFLASSILFAIKEACRSARADAGVFDKDFPFNAPATSEKIRLACVDDFTKQFNKK